jgi:isochorismate hydrolase
LLLKTSSFDFISFAAVKYSKVKDLLKNIRDEKIKGKKYKIEVARKVMKKEEEEDEETHPKFASRKETNRR